MTTKHNFYTGTGSLERNRQGSREPSFPVRYGLHITGAFRKFVPIEIIRSTLHGLRLGLYGCGAIGKGFVKLASPFGPEMLAYDPFASPIPDGRKAPRVEHLMAESGED